MRFFKWIQLHWQLLRMTDEQKIEYHNRLLLELTRQQAVIRPLFREPRPIVFLFDKKENGE